MKHEKILRDTELGTRPSECLHTPQGRKGLRVSEKKMKGLRLRRIPPDCTGIRPLMRLQGTAGLLRQHWSAYEASATGEVDFIFALRLSEELYESSMALCESVDVVDVGRV